jgi:hypothetical protein
MGGGGVWGVAGSQPMSTGVHMETNKLWKSNSIFNLWFRGSPRVGGGGGGTEGITGLKR